MGRHIHVLSELDAETRTAVCAHCGPTKVTSGGRNGSWRCYTAKKQSDQTSSRRKEYMKQYAAEYYQRTGGMAQRRATLRPYGITPEQYDEQLEAQGGVCMACKKPCSTGNRLPVDHCHETGFNRDLLCNKCNRLLGLAGDDADLLEFLAGYVRRWRDIHQEMRQGGFAPPVLEEPPADRTPWDDRVPATYCSVVCSRNHLLVARNAIVVDKGPDAEPGRACRACASGMKKVSRYAKRGVTLDPQQTCDEMYAVIMGEAPRPKGGRPRGSKNSSPRSDKGILRGKRAPAES